MATCKYCGKKAGIFSSAHKECQQRHSRGMADLATDLDQYFALALTPGDVASKLSAYRQDAYLSDDDIADAFDRAVRKYTDNLCRPYSPRSMHLVDSLVAAIGVNYQLLSAKGGCIEFAKRLMHGFLVDYFTDKLPLTTSLQRCGSVLRRFPMSQQQIDDTYWYVLDRAATNFLNDDVLSDREQQKIHDFVQATSLALNNIPAKYQGGDISKISQIALLKALRQGIMPTTDFNAPIILARGETVIWAYHGVKCYQEKITKEYVGRSSGLSFRLMKGVYYRTGRMRGHPVEHSSMEPQGTGTLYVTNRHLVFYSPAKSVKVALSRIIGITPYSDGIEVHRDGANARRLTIQGFDPWLLMNIISDLP